MSEVLCGKAEYVVAVDETDCLGRVKPSAWLQYMQDLATAHAEAIGVGFHTMYERGLLWVLTKISLRVVRAPAIGERLRAETYPKKPGRVECVRDFWFYGSDGTQIAAATTVWCVIDTQSRRIRRAAEFFPYPDSSYREDDALTQPWQAIASCESAPEAYRGRVLFADLDRNRHLNNARYGDMLLNACPDDYLLSREIAGFDLHFMRELTAGEAYSVKFCADGDAYSVETNGADGRVFAARCTTRPWRGGIR